MEKQPIIFVVLDLIQIQVIESHRIKTPLVQQCIELYLYQEVMEQLQVQEEHPLKLKYIV